MAKAASLLIRQLDAGVKRRLRLSAAANERSMEDEARAILGAALASGRATPPPTVAEPAAPAMPATGRLAGTAVLLVIAGGIAAYKSLDLIRRLRERGATVRAVMTKAATEFVTPLSVGALTASRVFTDLFARDDEHDVGHIRLAREADLVIVAPATADLMARMAAGRADDLASAILLATRAPVLLAPAMNPAMWAHPATRRNVATLRADGVRFVGPDAGEMAESGEAGVGRMAEVPEIVAAAASVLGADGPLAGRHVIVTSGPTREALDPVRYLANRSSGRQGQAIASAAARAGARVTLVSGPVALADPPGVETVHVESARQMLDAVTRALPADVAVMAAAVADWRPEIAATGKIKKSGKASPPLKLVENPDILATVAIQLEPRPATRHRLCRRDRRPHRQRSSQAEEEGRRLDRRQRCDRGRRHGWRREPRAHRDGGGRGSLAADAEGRGRRAPRRADRRDAGGGETVTAIALKVRRLPNGAGLALPARRTDGSAGLDLEAAVTDPLVIPPGGRALIPTGFAIALPAGFEGQVRPRSGLAVKHGVTVLNAPGTIDADYRGEIKVPLINHGDAPFTVSRGMRIAQLVVAAVASVTPVEVADLDETGRGADGFGSTGVSG